MAYSKYRLLHFWADLRVSPFVSGEPFAPAPVAPVSVELRFQEWPGYNAAQVHYKDRIAELLRDLCAAIDDPVQKRGRPRVAAV